MSGAPRNIAMAATLIEWRDRFLAGGEGVLKSRETGVEDEKRRRLKSVIATVSVENELLRDTAEKRRKTHTANGDGMHHIERLFQRDA